MLWSNGCRIDPGQGTAELAAGRWTVLVVAANLVYFGTHVFPHSIGDPARAVSDPV